MPEAILQHLDLSRLTLRSGALVGPRSEFRADLLFDARLREEPILVAILLEHQSTVRTAMPLRLLGYEVRVWKRYHAEHPKNPLPIIVPVVVSHDPRGWHAKVQFSDLFAKEALGIPALRALIPDFRFILQDISCRSDADLQRAALAALPRLALWAMRDARTPGRILATLDAWVDTLSDVLNAEGGMDALTLVFRYIAEVEKDLSFDQLHEKLAELSPKTGDAVMTIAEQLRTEGREQGLEQGREQGLEQGREQGLEQGKREGKAETLTRLLQLKFGDVLPDEVERIETASNEELDVWFTRSVTAESREEVWG